MFVLLNDTDKIEFDRSNYVLTTVDYGAIGATHSTAKGVAQVGERLISTALDTRDVSIVGFIRSYAPPGLKPYEREEWLEKEMKAKKARILQMCDPRRSFRIQVNKSLVLNCNATATVKFAPSKLINNTRVAQFVIDAFCPDPLFADAVAKYAKIIELKSNFTWPLEIPDTGFTFAEYSDAKIAELKNGGDIETGLLIHFYAGATVQNPALTDVATGEYIKLNHTFAPGETVVVNTNYGQESVTSYNGAAVIDKINTLDLSSSFLQARPGSTKLHFDALSNSVAMTVTIYYHQRYLGV